MLYLLALLVAVANSRHLAEQHFICNTCKHVSEHLISDEIDTAFKWCHTLSGNEYTSLCGDIASQGSTIKSLHSKGFSFDNICEKLNFCDFTSEIDWSKIPALNDEIIDYVNNGNVGWVAGRNGWWENKTVDDVRYTLGTIIDPDFMYTLPEISYTEEEYKALPTSFDTRTEWPMCNTNITGHVRDQSSCGSCWAFGSSEAFNDRLCIWNTAFQAKQQLLSVEETTSCCSGLQCGGSAGCNGGQPSAAWDWFTSHGIVSGGDYDDMGKTDTCSPYSLPNCAHHEPSSDYTPCPTTEYHTPKCESSCSNSGYPVGYSNDNHKATTAYNVRNNINDIMTEIYTYGTVTTSFEVYEDFETYTSGVYKHTTGRAVGGHSVKIIGWGVESGQDYWLCVNSWNQDWGMQGLFKILKGVNECGIESGVCAGHV